MNSRLSNDAPKPKVAWRLGLLGERTAEYLPERLVLVRRRGQLERAIAHFTQFGDARLARPHYVNGGPYAHQVDRASAVERQAADQFERARAAAHAGSARSEQDQHGKRD